MPPAVKPKRAFEMSRILRHLALVSVLALSACGGGSDSGAGGGSAPPPSGTPIGTTAAARLLNQGTFGASYPSITGAAGQSYDDWFARQAAIRPSLLAPQIALQSDPWRHLWWKQVVQGPDQLRQRVAFALSEIFVISEQNAEVISRAPLVTTYYDLLVNNALGNFRTLLEDVTLSPAMGKYLNMFRNQKENPAEGIHADQNFAREVMQLFTVGLVELNLDGTPKLDRSGKPIPTYDFDDIKGLSDVFTGWASRPEPIHTDSETAWRFSFDQRNPMQAYPQYHDTNAKRIIGGVVVPAGGSAEEDLRIALDTLFEHPNVGPFVGSQLIKRLVTSNPSPAYVARVASVFNNNGAGVRGDLLAVVRAILTDVEAVTPGGNHDGKLREPILRLTHLWRAFDAVNAEGGYDAFHVVSGIKNYAAQSPLLSPTVFNFFAPDYQRSGPLGAAGLVAPEFQITNENTLVRTNNMFQRFAYQYEDSHGRKRAGPQEFDESNSIGSSTVLLKTAAWEPLADEPTQLLDRLDLVLMANTMPTSMRDALVGYVEAIPPSEDGYRARRVIEAADLIINSPQYQVQR